VSGRSEDFVPPAAQRKAVRRTLIHSILKESTWRRFGRCYGFEPLPDSEGDLPTARRRKSKAGLHQTLDFHTPI